jgi:tetratricopeptide (TPR) repeat protein
MRRRGAIASAAITLAAILAVGAVATPAAAEALDPPERARVLSDQGRAYHDSGDYDRAITSFQAAYELAPSPALLFNLGQAYRLRGDCDRAAIMYRSYLGSRPGGTSERLARSQLTAVERCMQRRHARLRLTAGDGSGEASGFTGGVRDDRPTPAPGRTLRRRGIGVAAGGGALLLVAAYYGVRSAEAGDELEDAYASGAKWPELEAIDAKGKRAETLATLFALGGAAAAVTGGVMYYVGWRDAERARAPSAVTLVPHAGGAQVQAVWAF